MVHFLRDVNNNSIAEIEIYNKKNEEGKEYTEISSSIDIPMYSIWLLERERLLDDTVGDKEKDKWVLPFIYEFSRINEIRGWMWETRFSSANSNDGSHKEEIEEEISKYFRKLAEQYNLRYVTD